MIMYETTNGAGSRVVIDLEKIRKIYVREDSISLLFETDSSQTVLPLSEMSIIKKLIQEKGNSWNSSD